MGVHFLQIYVSWVILKVDYQPHTFQKDNKIKLHKTKQNIDLILPGRANCICISL